MNCQGNSRQPVPQNVSLKSSDLGPTPSLRQASRRPLEVDWMRSDGRVHMIQDSGERSAIIWVKRQHPNVLPDDGSDQQSIAASPERPIILRERIPDSLNISSQR